MDEYESLLRLGERIRNERKRAGLSQTELAARIGYSLNGIAKIERGESDPKYTALFRIASTLGIPITRVVTDSSENDRDELAALRESIDDLKTTNAAMLERLAGN